jgi:glycosyltransferase involved in cell wall biosynthesis
MKIGFVLLSNTRDPIPSTRIAVLNMFPFLRAAGFEPHAVFEPAHATETPEVPDLAHRLVAEGFRIVVFQKVHGPSVEALARKLSASGVRTVYAVCDRVDAAMAAATDITIAVTDYLRSLYPRELQAKIHVVHDGIEHPDRCKTEWREDRGSRQRPLRAVLVTSDKLERLPLIGEPPEWLEVTIVGRYPAAGKPLRRLREVRWKLDELAWQERVPYLRFLANRRIRCVPWHPSHVYDVVRQSDIGIIPIETSPAHGTGAPAPAWKVKSENRLTMKMSVGLPVIATPIPAYEPVIQQHRNGFLARSQQEWTACLEALREPKARRAIGARARESVLTAYSMEEQARRLVEVLRALVSPCVVKAVESR